MKLSFRYQFTLAPLVVVILLACLVAYTLFELSKINDENKLVRDSEFLSDRIQMSISSANHIRRMIVEFSTVPQMQEHELFFNYLEQIGILSDSLRDKYFQEQATAELLQLMNSTDKLLNKPEQVDQGKLDKSLKQLLDVLKYQFKIFSAQRRTIFINNYQQLIKTTSRMTTILLSGLILCIILATGLTFWGLTITRRRLANLNQGAHQACFSDKNSLPISKDSHDEIDELGVCITNMAKRLLKIVSIKNVLAGAENERRRIAMDIHDSVLTDLTTINRSLDNTNNIPLSVEKIKVLRTDVDNVIASLRQTIDDLHPQVLETLGLESALRSFLERQKEIPGFPNLHFSFTNEIESILSFEEKLNIFRILIEAINNVIKHAQSDRLEVNLRIISEQLIATVEDNGIGINEDNTKNTMGHGCLNITERAALIGVSVQWQKSRFSTGTCLKLILMINSINIAKKHNNSL